MSETNGDEQVYADEFNVGLTKRELFASMAMQGLVTDSSVPIDRIPSISTGLADALLKELEKS